MRRAALCTICVLAAYLALVRLGVWAESTIYGPEQQLPLIQADYQRCIPVNPGGPIKPVRGRINGRGTSPLT